MWIVFFFVLRIYTIRDKIHKHCFIKSIKVTFILCCSAMNLISSLLHLLICIFNEKMINTPHYLRNANQNYNEISPHNGQNGRHHKKYTKIKAGEGVEKKGTLLPCWWECKLIQPLWKTVWRVLKKLAIKPPYDPAIPLLGIYPEKTIVQKDTCTSVFNAALFTIART